jgi:hypothetical protein
MQNSEFLNDKIEAYLNGNLSEADKALFEAEVHKDPLLRNEVALQRATIEGLKQQRRLALKARLSNVELPPVDLTASIGEVAVSTIVKVLGGAAILGGTVWGAYTYMNSDGTSNNADNLATKEQPEANKTIEVNSATEQNDKSSKAKTTVVASNKTKNDVGVKNAPLSDAADVVHTSPVAPKPKAKNKVAATANEREAEVNLSAPKNDSDEASNFDKHDNNANVPVGSVVNESVKDAVKPEVVINNDNSQYQHHYKYNNNKLFLYGDFNNKPYELIEFNNANGRKLFIFHNNAYYEIQDTQSEITPLMAISDRDAIENLSSLRKKKTR